MALFGTFKDSPVQCRSIRAKIRNGELPELPKSKVNPAMEMCLGWHCKGMCNSNCSRSADHVQYTQAEYQPLSQWCTTNWPVAAA